MTANQGPGVPDELRERCIAVNSPCVVVTPEGERVEFPAMPTLTVDKVFREIAAAGYAIVPADRYERLRMALGAIDTVLTLDGGEGVSKWGILPGDLDPVEEGRG